MKYAFLIAAFLSVSVAQADENWPQPAGPNGSWMTTGTNVPLHWSVTRNQNILRKRVKAASPSGATASS